VKLGRLRYASKYLAIQHFHTEQYWSINWMCKQLRVTRAAYYKWLARDIPDAEKENKTIAQLIQEYDDRFNHILGYRRMTDWINRLNSTSYSRNRIHRIMKELNIHSVIRRKKKKYVNSTPEITAENTLSRDFNAERPNQKWTTDVTEFKWYEGAVVHKLYLSAILDLYDRSIVSYVVSTRNDNKLVFDTFEKAILANPDAHPLFHSDRGFQYTSKVFQFKLSQQAMEQSMSRVGHCIDNCPTEGFWGVLKAEMYYLTKFCNEADLREAIDKYIHFYNYERFQKRFNTQTPMEVRNAAMNTNTPEQFPIAENKRIQQYKAKFAA
jgi:transposase InsO family protein